MHLFEESFVVVEAVPDDFVSFLAPVGMRNFDSSLFARHIFIRQEVVFEPLGNDAGQFADVVVIAVRSVVFKYGDDFIVGFRAVQHPQSANGTCRGDDIAVRDIFFGQDADVERIAVAGDIFAFNLFHTMLGKRIATIALRDESVERRHHA